MGLLTRDQIHAASALKREAVPCPEWGGDVLVQELTAEGRGRFFAIVQDAQRGKRPFGDVYAEVALLGCVDEAGAPLFLAGDLAWLVKRSSAPLNRIFEAVQQLSGMTVDAAEVAKALFPDPPSASSSSSSPNISG